MDEKDFSIKNNTLLKYCGTDKYVQIPNGIIKIDDEAFFHNNIIKDVTIPNSVNEIGRESFSECEWLKHVNIPNSVDTIGSLCFSDCRNLLSIIIPDSVNQIELGAFSMCTSLNHVELSDNITKISQSLFNYCISLTNIDIPEKVTYIDDYAFEDCCSLKSIYILGKLSDVGDDVFTGCDSITDIYVNDEHTLDLMSKSLESEELKYIYGANLSWVNDKYNDIINNAIVSAVLKVGMRDVSLNTIERLLSMKFIKNNTELSNYLLSYLKDNFTEEEIEEFRTNELLGIDNDEIKPHKKG